MPKPNYVTHFFVHSRLTFKNILAAVLNGMENKEAEMQLNILRIRHVC